MAFKLGDYEVKIANSLEERRQVRALRYRCFVQEEGASATPEQKKLREEWDKYDVFAEYLIVLHNGNVVGTYRIINRDAAEKMGGFYTETEFDISKIKKSGANIAEMSRACVAPEYRDKKIILRLLWAGLDEYIKNNNIDILFGMASFMGTNPEKSAMALSYLYHNHLASPDLRANVKKAQNNKNQDFTKMNLVAPDLLDLRTARNEMPPLIKGYLNLNAKFGDGVFIDKKFNSYEVFVVLRTRDINPEYKQRFLSGLTRARN